MIKLVTKNNIDLCKYDACIEKSVQSKLYAFSWYLDLVADDWKVLILNDYQAVMPIPYLRTKRNLFLKKIMQPLFCQQLGVFSLDELSDTTYQDFIHHFLGLHPKIYQFNTENSSFLKTIDFHKTPRINYELSLHPSYENLQKNYSKNLKRNLIKAKKNDLSIRKIAVDVLIDIKKRQKHVKLSMRNYQKLKQLIITLQQRNVGACYGVFEAEVCVAAAFFAITPQRIYHLVSVTTTKGKEVAAMSFLFDDVIKSNEKKHIILDFEGSMLAGVARFFKSFGAVPNTYYQFKI